MAREGPQRAFAAPPDQVKPEGEALGSGGAPSWETTTARGPAQRGREDDHGFEHIAATLMDRGGHRFQVSGLGLTFLETLQIKTF